MIAVSSLIHPAGGLASFSKTLLLKVSSLRKSAPKVGKEFAEEDSARSTEMVLKKNIAWDLLSRHLYESKK
jgi:hypothetical protein